MSNVFKILAAATSQIMLIIILVGVRKVNIIINPINSSHTKNAKTSFEVPLKDLISTVEPFSLSF